MKNIIIVLLALCPLWIQAGIIVKKSGERLEDVTIKSASGSDIIYVTEEGTEVSLPKSEISAVLYDDGRYEEMTYTIAPSGQQVEQHAYVAENEEHKQIKTEVNQDTYLFPIKSAFVRNDVVVVAIGKQLDQTSQKKETYWLCVDIEDGKIWKTLYKKHKETYQQFYKSTAKASKELRFYDVASQASKAYMAKKAESASVEDACLALVTTFISAVDNREITHSSEPSVQKTSKSCYSEAKKIAHSTFIETQKAAIQNGDSKSVAYKRAKEASDEAYKQAIDNCSKE